MQLEVIRQYVDSFTKDWPTAFFESNTSSRYTTES